MYPHYIGQPLYKCVENCPCYKINQSFINAWQSYLGSENDIFPYGLHTSQLPYLLQFMFTIAITNTIIVNAV